MKHIAILQSNYIPWKSYFDIVASVDEFIIYDDVQFTKNDWRNRNLIKTPQGLSWISIPVGPDIKRQIRDVTLPTMGWAKHHWKTLAQNYSKAPFFDAVADWLKPLYLESQHTHLSNLNRTFMESILSYLGVRTKLTWSWEYEAVGDRNERLVSLCLKAGATEYVSGPAAKAYLDVASFAAHGISVRWVDYSGYPEYPQLWGPFEHQVTILDLLFNCGPSAARYMKHVPA